MSHPALAASRRAVDYTRLLVRDYGRLERDNRALATENKVLRDRLKRAEQAALSGQKG